MINRLPALSPIRPFDRFSKLMEEMFPEPDELRTGWYPSVDVKETDKELNFFVDLPGVKDEDIDVEVSGDVLTVRGKREFKSEERKEDYVRLERSYGSFCRTFNLGFPVKPEDIVAECHSGVLKITVPKAETAMTHKIQIRANGQQ